MKNIDYPVLFFCFGLFVVMTLFNLTVTYAPSDYRLLPSVIGGGLPVFTIGILGVLIRTFQPCNSIGKAKYFFIHATIVIAFGLAAGLIQFACLPKL